MLPFLKQRREAGLIIQQRKPDSPDEPKSDDQGLTVAAQDLCDAIEVKDYKRMAAALKAVFDILESMPHDEAPEASESEQE